MSTSTAVPSLPAATDPGLLQVDDRERSPELLQALAAEGFVLQRIRLPAGDLLLPGRWRVERKTITDFRASLFDGRLFRQAAQLRRHPEAPLIILEGAWEETPPLPGELGALLALVIDAGLPVVPAPTPHDTARILGLLARRRRLRASPSRHGAARTFLSPAHRLVASLPGIGPTRATALLQAFPTLAALTAATTPELERVPGIGPGIAHRLERIFHYPP